MHAEGFLPISTPAARVLILGSMPGQASLRQAEYYAHPRNAFWRIMEALFNVPAALTYAQRTVQLARCGVAVWDVCAVAYRPGSLDTAIRADSVHANDFAGFFESHPQITRVCFNGAKAAQLYRKHVKFDSHMEYCELPSTSPAHASLSFDQKLARWASIKRDTIDTSLTPVLPESSPRPPHPNCVA